MNLFHVETNELGVTRRYYSNDRGDISIEAIQDIEQNIEHCKTNQVERGKKITSELYNPIASIPHIIALKWLSEDGWWWQDCDKDPDVAKKLKAKLNCSDWRYLRTSELRV